MTGADSNFLRSQVGARDLARGRAFEVSELVALALYRAYTIPHCTITLWEDIQTDQLVLRFAGVTYPLPMTTLRKKAPFVAATVVFACAIVVACAAENGGADRPVDASSDATSDGMNPIIADVGDSASDVEAATSFKADASGCEQRPSGSCVPTTDGAAFPNIDRMTSKCLAAVPSVWCIDGTATFDARGCLSEVNVRPPDSSGFAECMVREIESTRWQCASVPFAIFMSSCGAH